MSVRAQIHFDPVYMSRSTSARDPDDVTTSTWRAAAGVPLGGVHDDDDAPPVVPPPDDAAPQMPSVVAVWRPATPSTTSRLAVWKATTPRRVWLPKAPSTGPTG